MEYGLVLLWLATVAGLAAIAAPLASFVFAPLSDRGGTLALPFALAAVGVVSYLVGQVAFGWPALIASLVVLGGGSAFALSRDHEPDWESVGLGLAAVAVGFALVVAIRNADPGIYAGGGEKFLDFGLLKSLVRAESLPPEDFWYAGDRVQYYYGGHLIAAQLTRLTGIAPRYAYNLALATFFGALVGAAFGLARNLAAERDLPRTVAGALALFFVGFASNLAPVARLVVWLLPSSMKTYIDENPAAQDGPEAVRAFGHTWTDLALGPDQFYYWPASRVIPNTINEFPLFAFLNGDLHAHMMSTPLLLVTAAVGFAYWLTPAAQVWRRRAYVFVCAPLLAGLLAVVNTWSYPSVAGLTTLAVLFAGAHPASLLPASVWERLDPATDSRAVSEILRMLGAGVAGIAVGLLGALVAFPFFTGATSGQSLALLPGRSGASGLLLVHGAFLLVSAAFLAPRIEPDLEPDLGMVAPLTVLAAVAVANAIGGWIPVPLVLVGGGGLLAVTQVEADERGPAALLFLLAIGVTVAATGTFGAPFGALGVYGATVVVAVGAAVAGFDTDTQIVALAIAAFLVLAAAAIAVDLAILAVVFPVLALGWMTLRLGRDLGYETVLLVAAVGLVTMVEFIYVSERAGSGRYNTVFKFYMQVWVLWGTAAGVMLVDVVARQWPDWSIGERLAARRSASGQRAGQVASVGLAVVLVVSLSVYGGLALSGHFETNDANTLDSKAWAEGTYPDQSAAIEWLDDREGRPVVVEQPTREHVYGINSPSTQLVSGVSSMTGLPTIAGWTHASNYHTEAGWQERVGEVRTVYTGNSTARAEVLATYDVQYIYVGPHERQHQTVDDLAAEPYISVAERFGDVVIYEVDRSALGTANRSR
ncbi:DUF2298 domain-containing protein [Haloarchaeobius litoreus]|uniref:DUF2298 domain-containing protein n=1 Tax=Haloarchaeobius litoreus TaxID=755306 RepID=A0ABD6DEV9_9EURY|nr:DUF2298 domain-containing protein [Haloarchaeobius litoreus]